MSLSMESEIASLLHQRIPLAKIAAHFYKKWTHLTLDEKKTIANFWLHTTQYLTLVKTIVSQLSSHQSSHQSSHLSSDQESIPWAQFASAIVSINPNDTLLFHLESGADELNQRQELSRCYELDLMLPGNRHTREKRLEELQQNHLKKKSSLLDQIQFYRGQKLLQQEKKLLEKLTRLFPNDSEVKTYQARLFDDQAHIRLKQKGSRSKTRINTPTQDPPEANPLLLSALDLVNQQNAMDLAIMMFQMEAFEASLTLLNFAPPSPPRDWLHLEILLKQNRFLEVIELCEPLKSLYGNNPESHFGVAYLKAQAAWGLRQNDLAIAILEEIMAIRPNYRATSTLLSQWKAAG